MSVGTIFMIEEFAIYDGPGIRTCVFLKGCPLKCMWCHSPEGQSPLPQLVRSPNGCLRCGACTKKGEELTGAPTLVHESIAVCPHRLIRVCGEQYTSDELVRKLCKNAEMLQKANGGVTFSGGEPLMQSEFLTECLVKLKGTLHRAIQTCGFASPQIFGNVLSQTDYVLFDLKLMNKDQHRHYCKQDNAVILQNYQALAASGVPFITRIPLIPTVNDTIENLCKTAEFMHKNKVTKVELLPYHNMTGSKYALIGKEYHPSFDESRFPELHTEIFSEYGIEVTVL